jgi:hypothetical protein
MNIERSGKYFQPITATAQKITATEIDLTLTWSSKKSYIIILLPVKSIHFMGLRLYHALLCDFFDNRDIFSSQVLGVTGKCIGITHSFTKPAITSVI